MNIFINKEIFIRKKELKESFSRSSGPGGQNVNKVNTAVTLRFHINNSSLPENIKTALYKTAKNKINTEGELIIEVQRFRTQEKNRKAALEQLIKIIRRASIKPKKRIKTKVPKAEKEKRKISKKQQSLKKKFRKSPSIENE